MGPSDRQLSSEVIINNLHEYALNVMKRTLQTTHRLILFLLQKVQYEIPN